MASPVRTTLSHRRRLFAVLVVATAVAVPMIIAPNAGAAKSRFGVVVVHENDDVSTECVRLSADRIRAFDLLQATNLEFFTTSFGSLGRSVCYLDGEGHLPPTGCFGTDPDDPSWGLWFQKKGQEPRPSSAGLSTLKLKSGWVMYMVFKPFEPPDFTQEAPDGLSLQTICST